MMEPIMTPLVELALTAYKHGNSDVARKCFMKMTAEEKDAYLTAVRELDADRSD